MVELVVYDFEEVTDLEHALINADIEYQVKLDTGNYGIKVPYLIINGAPLDKKRAMIWIKGCANG